MSARYLIAMFLAAPLLLMVNNPLQAQWALNGIPIADTTGDQVFPQLTSDGMGGAIIVWQDKRDWSVNRQYWDIYAQRVDSSGHTLWQRNGVPVAALREVQYHPRIVSDGQGGAIIAWEDFRNYFEGKVVDIYAQRINGEGKTLWQDNGIPVVVEVGEQSTVDMIPDGQGGAILTWLDARSPEGFVSGNIYAQRINFEGRALWDSNGVAVCTASGFQTVPRLTSDGAGGAIITWYGERYGYEVYAQRVDSAGGVVWHGDGVFIGNTKFFYFPDIATDGFGGAVIIWNSGNDIAAQRITSGGRRLWGERGVTVFSGSDESNPKIVNSENSYFAVAKGWQGRLFSIQKLDSLGGKRWSENGAAIDSSRTGAVYVYPAIPDGEGGIILSWEDERAPSPRYWRDVFAQRLDASGGWPWGERTVYVCYKLLPDEYPDLISDGVGGAIIAWHGRNDTTVVDFNVYAQRVYGDGRLGGTKPSAVQNRQGESNATKTVAGLELEAFPNPFNATVTIAYRIPQSMLWGAEGSTKATFRIYNILGEEVLAWVDLAGQGGAFSVIWDGKDKSGKEVTSGIYLVVVKAGALSKKVKAMLLR